MKKVLVVGGNISFINENLPYKIMAVSPRYAIVTRPFDRKEDDDLLAFEVERGASVSKKVAFEKIKNNVVYSILDFNENVKGPNNLIFSHYDYKSTEDCIKCIADLEEGKIEISHRNRVELVVDWDKTTF